MVSCPSCARPVADDARFCPDCASPIERATDSAEERKLATVLFADLVGSTELAGSQDPERTRAVLNRFYDAMAVEIAEAGGTVEKFVGDAVMAAFGAPAAQEDHAERALHTALSMKRRLDELFGDSLSLRIGVNTGDVVVGSRARAARSSLAMRSTSPRASSRPRSRAKSRRGAHGGSGRWSFEFGDQATITAKGKTDGVACRRLVRVLFAHAAAWVGGLRHSFVGANASSKRCNTRMVASSRNGSRGSSDHGDAGIGKITLIREFWEWLGAQAPETRSGAPDRASRTGAGLTYLPLGEVVREHFGLLESDSPETVRRRLGSRAILGLTLGLEAPVDLHPLAARDRLRQALGRVSASSRQRRPAVVLVEDIHWADDALLELIEAALDDVDAPLLLAGDRTTGVHAPAGRRPSAFCWRRSPQAEASRMIDELFRRGCLRQFGAW